MLQSWRDPLLDALQSRIVLLTNHVLSREPAAMRRLQAHAGRTLRIEPVGVPRWLPSLPPLSLTITPAGLVDLATEGGADLSIRMPADEPLRWLAAAAGASQPGVEIVGDATFAADIHWLVDNVRWDIEADLADLLGPVAAHGLARMVRVATATLRQWAPHSADNGTERR